MCTQFLPQRNTHVWGAGGSCEVEYLHKALHSTKPHPLQQGPKPKPKAQTTHISVLRETNMGHEDPERKDEYSEIKSTEGLRVWETQKGV